MRLPSKDYTLCYNELRIKVTTSNSEKRIISGWIRHKILWVYFSVSVICNTHVRVCICFKEHIQSCSHWSVLRKPLQSFDNGPHNAVQFWAQFEVQILAHCININFSLSFLSYLMRVGYEIIIPRVRALLIVTLKTKLTGKFCLRYILEITVGCLIQLYKINQIHTA